MLHTKLVLRQFYYIQLQEVLTIGLRVLWVSNTASQWSCVIQADTALFCQHHILNRVVKKHLISSMQWLGQLQYCNFIIFFATIIDNKSSKILILISVCVYESQKEIFPAEFELRLASSTVSAKKHPVCLLLTAL